MRQAREQMGAENSAATAAIAGRKGASREREPAVLLGFLQWHGVC